MALLLLLSCEEKESGSARVEPSEGEVILIGGVGPLTGAHAVYGNSINNGVALAIRDANARGGVNGKQLSLRFYDDQARPEEAANAVMRLIAQDGVKVIIGSNASTNSLAMAPRAQAAQIPMITPSSTHPKVTEMGDYVFRACFLDAFQGFVMAKFAREHTKATTAAVLSDQKSDYSISLAEVFAQELGRLGGEVVSREAYAQGDTDFRAQLTAIKKHKPDVLFIPGYYTDVGLIARQAREIGLKATMLGGDGWESEKLFELGGSAIDGGYYVSHFALEDPAPHIQAYVAAYREAYAKEPDGLSALSYDTAMVAIAAMKRAPDLSGPALRDAIAKTRDFQGIAGRITFDEKRNPIKPAFVVQLVGGKLKYVATVDPSR
jgi:branched-chain amino acid transport system substrate-binding protein